LLSGRSARQGSRMGLYGPCAWLRCSERRSSPSGSTLIVIAAGARWHTDTTRALGSPHLGAARIARFIEDCQGTADSEADALSHPAEYVLGVLMLTGSRHQGVLVHFTVESPSSFGAVYATVWPAPGSSEMRSVVGKGADTAESRHRGWARAPPRRASRAIFACRSAERARLDQLHCLISGCGAGTCRRLAR
jgi:hypothetical protein